MPQRPAFLQTFASPNLRAFLAGMLLNDSAIQIQSVAVGWHVFMLDHRALDLGLVGLTLFLPTLLLALVAGVFADRHDRRAIAAGAVALEALCSLALAALVFADERRLWVYLAVIACIGVARAFGMPAERTLLVSIVEPEHYLRSQALYASARETIVIVGPALGGALVAVSTVVAFGASAVLLLCGGAALALLQIRRAGHAEAPTLRSAFDGLRFIASRPVVAGAISLDLFAVLFGGATALLPVFAVSILHVGPVGLGVLRSAPALGAAIVAAALVRRPPRRRVGPMLLSCVAGFGVATIVFGLSTNMALSLVMLAIIGGTDMVSVVIRNGLVQMSTPNAMRGRVNAVENVFIGASNELGAFESGGLAALVGAVPAVVIGGAATLAVIALWAVLFPALRRASSLEESAALV